MISAQHAMPSDTRERDHIALEGGQVQFGKQETRKKDHVAPCDQCGGEVHRSRRRSFISYALSCFSVYPYRCNQCKARLLRIRWEQTAVLATLLLAGIGAVVATNAKVTAQTWAREHSGKQQELLAARDTSDFSVLGNQEVVALAQAELSPEVITRLVRTTPHTFTVDAQSLIALKKAGTPDDVIAAMVEVTPVGRKHSNPAVERLAPVPTNTLPVALAPFEPSPQTMPPARNSRDIFPSMYLDQTAQAQKTGK